ncbi:MAG: galactokinase [Clostridia bacterium]|nr:galactokinase [Clostridia bacterium]
MNAKTLISRIQNGGLQKYAAMYEDVSAQETRYIEAIKEFESIYGKDRDLFLFSVPGRTEVLGNHTDHNNGKVMAAAINRDLIAVVSPAKDQIRVKSQGYDEDVIPLSEIEKPEAFADFSSASLIAGMAGGFVKDGYAVGGFDAYTTNDVLKGSGLSSSAGFEVMIGNILNHLYNGGEIDNAKIAKIAQYAENVYFGKPCGLMDQTACAVGGFVYIDFEDKEAPEIEPLSFSLADAGYALCITNTGGNHADLTPDYAAVPAEMKAVAAYFGKEVLRGLTEADILENIPVLRKATGDRAIMRALHFVRENNRVEKAREALLAKDLKAFFDCVSASGRSSLCYLQNVFTTKNVHEQGITLALAVSDGLLAGKDCAWRVHGGGFAGTMQAFVKKEYVSSYAALMDATFGKGACMILSVRAEGAIQVEV